MGAAGLDAQLMTVGEVAELMRVSNMTVYRLIKAGQLGAVRVGRSYRIRRRDLESYLAERSVQRPSDMLSVRGANPEVWAREEA